MNDEIEKIFTRSFCKQLYGATFDCRISNCLRNLCKNLPCVTIKNRESHLHCHALKSLDREFSGMGYTVNSELKENRFGCYVDNNSSVHLFKVNSNIDIVVYGNNEYYHVEIKYFTDKDVAKYKKIFLSNSANTIYNRAVNHGGFGQLFTDFFKSIIRITKNDKVNQCFCFLYNDEGLFQSFLDKLNYYDTVILLDEGRGWYDKYGYNTPVWGGFSLYYNKKDCLLIVDNIKLSFDSYWEIFHDSMECLNVNNNIKHSMLKKYNKAINELLDFFKNKQNIRLEVFNNGKNTLLKLKRVV